MTSHARSALKAGAVLVGMAAGAGVYGRSEIAFFFAIIAAACAFTALRELLHKEPRL